MFSQFAGQSFLTIFHILSVTWREEIWLHKFNCVLFFQLNPAPYSVYTSCFPCICFSMSQFCLRLSLSSVISSFIAPLSLSHSVLALLLLSFSLSVSSFAVSRASWKRACFCKHSSSRLCSQHHRRTGGRFVLFILHIKKLQESPTTKVTPACLFLEKMLK